MRSAGRAFLAGAGFVVFTICLILLGGCRGQARERVAGTAQETPPTVAYPYPPPVATFPT